MENSAKEDCPNCGRKLWGIQYDYKSAEYYDGISEWACPMHSGGCGWRRGRWSGKLLLGGEVEKRYGGSDVNKLDVRTAELLVEYRVVNKMAKMSTPGLSRAIRAGKVAFLANAIGGNSRALIKRARLLHEDLKAMGYQKGCGG